MHTVIGFDIALVLTKNSQKPGYLTVFDMAARASDVTKGAQLYYSETIIEKVLNRRRLGHR